MHRWLRAAVASAVVLTVAACASNNDNAMRGNNVQDGNGTRINRMDMNNWDGRTFNDGNVRGSRFGAHNNTRLEVSKEIADRIAAMSEVDSAVVLVTDRNVYVAVDLEDGAANGSRRYMNGAADNGGYGNADNGLNSRGRGSGMNNNGTAGTGGLFGSGNERLNDGIGINADRMTSSLKQRIAERVKAVRPNVQNVYVSADPEFANRLRGYANRLDDGRPIRGLIEEFNILVQRVFPTNAADGFDRTGYDRDDMGNVRTRNNGIGRGIFNPAR